MRPRHWKRGRSAVIGTACGHVISLLPNNGRRTQETPILALEHHGDRLDNGNQNSFLLIILAGVSFRPMVEGIPDHAKLPEARHNP